METRAWSPTRVVGRHMQYPSDIYMSPRIAIHRFYQIVSRCTCQIVSRGSNVYKEEKEALVAALILFGIEKRSGGQFWLQNAEHIFLDCDIKVVGRMDREKEVLDIEVQWQITDFESHTDNFVDVIKKKQKYGQKHHELDLIINVRDKGGWEFFPEKLADEINKIGSDYRSVRLVCDDACSERIYHVVELTPEVDRETYNVDEMFANAVGPDFIRQPAKYERYSPTIGEYSLPLPPCPKCGSV